MDILEKDVRRIYVENDETKVEWKKVKEVLDAEKDLVVSDEGTVIIKRQGIQKLAKFVGATWKKPEIVDTPTVNNGKAYCVLSECVFPDGTTNIGAGESNEKNTKIGGDFRFMTAINRANAISFLRSPYMDMYDVFSDEEAEAFQKQTSAKLQKDNQKLLDKQRQYSTMITEMSRLIALPDEDDQYPKAYVTDVWDVHRDLNYLKELTNHTDKVIQFVAKQKVREVETSTAEPTNHEKPIEQNA